MTGDMEHCDDKGMEHCDDRPWSIGLKNFIDYCDDSCHGALC